jgi:AcrR family transcriptional regulator
MDRMIAAAIAILDEQGAEALSMRTLAQRLESGTATLYRHFAGRVDLIARVVDAVMGEVDVDAEDLEGLPWQEACETLAHRMFDVMRRHPHVAPLMVERVPVGPRMLALRERALALLLDSGFPPSLAVRAWATLAHYVLGFGSQLTGGEDEPPAAWGAIDLTQLPATLAVAEHIPVPLQSEFSFGLELLISGLEARLSRD